MNVARRPPWGGAAFAAAALLLAARGVAGGESVDLGAFHLEVPAGYLRGNDDTEKALLAQTVAALQGTVEGGLQPDRAEMRLFVREDDGLEERFSAVWVPGIPPPADDVNFVAGQRSGLERSTRAVGGTIRDFGTRRSAGGLDYTEGIVDVPLPKVGACVLWTASVPRRGGLLMVALFERYHSGDDADSVWKAAIASLRTDLPPPPPFARGESTWRKAGKVVGYVLVGVIVLAFLGKALKRRPVA